MRPVILPEIKIIEEIKTELEPLYRVIVHNDDVTPMDFVVNILDIIFHVPNPAATHIMYTAHLHGTAHVQTLPKAEAEKRIEAAHTAAKIVGYPLRFSMEPE
jgi:ATP-dependent Clp protease adaptor protein ClpS